VVQILIVSYRIVNSASSRCSAEYRCWNWLRFKTTNSSIFTTTWNVWTTSRVDTRRRTKIRLQSPRKSIADSRSTTAAFGLFIHLYSPQQMVAITTYLQYKQEKKKKEKNTFQWTDKYPVIKRPFLIDRSKLKTTFFINFSLYCLLFVDISTAQTVCLFCPSNWKKVTNWFLVEFLQARLFDTREVKAISLRVKISRFFSLF